MEKRKIFIITEKDLARNVATIIDQLIPHVEISEIYDPKEAQKFLGDGSFYIIVMTEAFYKRLLISLRTDDIRKTIILSNNTEFIEECEKDGIRAVKRDNLEIGFKNILESQEPKEKK